ncbi:NAD(P)-dependent oxidoreductase [Affinibrenneria salicis]|uniref:NAD(P)-dependent oxidoreductase n=1 Tax=Affinibrenneria salicis TaxID=2590031 RepID=A0A5J5FY09_9GAMM|nr:NAD(P)-binding domain-containing protein [Affinibrenneria salicis]KAA8999012.1 NAD(P)-dependent oxidoreductase [Affinibrenneria salicis]
MKQQIGIVGMGSLGSALARRLLDCGYRVSVFNRTRSKADKLINDGAMPVYDIQKIFSESCNIVIACLKDADSIISTFAPLAGGGSQCRRHKLLINTSTLGPDESQRVDVFMRSIPSEYMEFPVSGGPEGARNGKLVAYMGPVVGTFLSVARDIADALCERYLQMDSNYHAQAMKVLNNYCEAMNMAVAAEAIHLAEKTGLNKEMICSALPMGRGRSVYMDVLLDKYQRDDKSISFPLDLRVKDLLLVAPLFKQNELVSFFYSRLADAWEKALDSNAVRVDQSAYLDFFKNYNVK